MPVYQLVLQFEELDFDTLTEIEDALIEALASSAEVDGHDIGSGEANIFIVTTKPEETFERVRELLAANPSSPNYRAAYRPVTSEQFMALWPPGLSRFRSRERAQA